MDNKDMVCRINAALAERNISKAQFYKDCGITSGAYSQWNQNKTSPSRRTLKRIADYLELDEEYLIVGSTQQQKKPPELLGELTPEEIKFIKSLRAVPDDRKEFVNKMLDSLISLSSSPQDQSGESSQ